MNIQGIRVTRLKVEECKSSEWRRAIRTPSAKIQAGVAPTDADFEGSDKVLKEVASLVKSDLIKVGYSADRGDNIGLHFPTLETDSVIVFIIPGGIHSIEEIAKMQGQGPVLAGENIIDLHRRTE